MKMPKNESTRSMKVSSIILILVTADFVHTAIPKWSSEEQFLSDPELEDEYIYEYGNADWLGGDGDDGNGHNCARCTIPTPACHDRTQSYEVEEPDYVDVANVGSSNYLKWDIVRNLYEKRIIGKLVRLCMFAHKSSGRSKNFSINAIRLDARKLIFQNPYYEPRFVDVISYGIKNETDISVHSWHTVLGAHNYITKGVRPGCVCYLILANSLKMEFLLHEHVCGVEMGFLTGQESTTQDEPTATTATAKKRRTSAKKSTRKTTKKLAVARKSTKKRKTAAKTTRKKYTSDTSDTSDDSSTSY